MIEMLGCPVGLSDHTMGVAVPIAAVALGACVIEKHFTLSRADGGVDSAFSLEKEELKALVDETYNAWQAMGRVSYQVSDKEEKSKKFRRSIYFVKDMQAGEVIKEEYVRCIRPGYGLEPKKLEGLIGKKVSRSVTNGEPVSSELVVI